MILVSMKRYGSGSCSETDNSTTVWEVTDNGTLVDSRGWRIFAVRLAKKYARRTGRTYITVADVFGKRKDVTV